MSTPAIVKGLRRFDAYPKTLEDFRIKTFGGAIVTLLSSILMFVLFVSELQYYMTTEVHPELFVDTSRGQKIKINIDMTFHKLPCSILSVDAMDVSGEQQIDVAHNLYKFRVDEMGKEIDQGQKEDLGKKPEKVKNETLSPNRCESCYGAETSSGQCCNTCEEVRDAYRKKGWAFRNTDGIVQCNREGYKKQNTLANEGCRLYGYLEVNKVAGNFHFAPGKSYQQHHVHVHDLQALAGNKYNSSHYIKHLSFGHDYPGIINPLDKASVTSDTENIMYQYFVKVVPTTYVKVTGKTLYTNQYSVTKHSKQVLGGTGEQGLPGVFVLYELSPMMVKYTEKRRSFMHFLTGVCAIIGGVFTVAGLVDAFIYHSSNVLKKKIELGKHT